MLHNKSITELSAGLAAGEYSSAELTKQYLQRIDQHADLNCYITVDQEGALHQAAEADKLIASGGAGPLTGVPLAHKDIFLTEGLRTTCGSRMLENFIAPYDATVVTNIKQAGMVTLGKANMDEFAMGSSNENSYFGSVLNPWNIKMVPGGSSGGSAAAVAAGLAPIATATDTGGSIRQPAALCGLTGMKPTYGRVSRWGMVAFASSLDQAGPMAQSAEDCALLMNTISGFDAKDSTCMDRPVDDYHANLNDSLEGLRVGLPREYFSDELDPAMRKVVDDALKVYEGLGAQLIEIDLPNTHLSIPVYYIVAPAECSSNLSRFDGVRYGYRCDDPKDLDDLYSRSRGEGFGAEVTRRIMIGTYALSSGYYDAYYLKAQQLRRLIKEDFEKAFEQVDVIMGPTSPDVAFPIGAKADDPVDMYLSDIYTISANLAGLPAMSLPVEQVNQLPAGLQLIGNYWSEARMLNIAHQFQQKTAWHQQKPVGFFEGGS